jgi:antitoxin HicB
MSLLKNKHIGSTLDSFLEEEGILQHTEAVAIKRTIVRELLAMIEQENITQTELARRMGTSKAAINRLLNPNNTSLTIQTLLRAAQALGKKVSFNFDG